MGSITKAPEPLTVGWIGAPPRGDLAEALRAAKIQARTRPGAGEAVQVIVSYTGTSRRPPPLDVRDLGVRWIWLTDDPVDPAAEIEAVLAGAYDAIALALPGAMSRLVTRLREAAVGESTPSPGPLVVAESQEARRMLAQVARAARTSMPVLLTGETGTGKEVCARLLHTWSSRAQKAFIPIDCAAIPNELMEAELFGYARGAFSGAVQAYDGQLAAAEGGTVLLDEVDDTPISTQAKLLRVLEDRSIARIGESTRRTVDFRLVAATNRDLRALILAGDFLPDLHERLAIVSIDLPPLRRRPEDLPLLAASLIARFYQDEPAARGGGSFVTQISPAALAALAAYPWPGNVRELRNVLFEALVYKRAGDELLLADLPRRVLRREAPQPSAAGMSGVVDPSAVTAQVDAGTFNLRNEIDGLERVALRAALGRGGGNATRAAELLGQVGHGRSRNPGNTVRAMMRRHRLT